MRKYPNVGFCFCGSKRYYQNENRFDDWNENNITYRPGVQNKEWFFTTFMFGMGPHYQGKKEFTGFIMTATTMVRCSLLEKIKEKFDIFNWRLRLGDATLWLACSAIMDGYYIEDQVSVYRISNSGVFQNPNTRTGVQIDGILVRLYYLNKHWNLTLRDCPGSILTWLSNLVVRYKNNGLSRATYAWSQLLLPRKALLAQFRLHMLPFWLCHMFGLYVWPFKNIAMRVAYCFGRFYRWPPRLVAKYSEVGL